MKAKGAGYTAEQNDRLRVALGELLETTGRTQVSVAEEFGVAPAQISRWRKGTQGFSYPIAMKLAEMLGYDLSALLRGDRVRVDHGDNDVPGLEDQIARAQEQGAAAFAVSGAARMARALGPATVTAALFDRLVDVADRFGSSDSVEAEIARAVEPMRTEGVAKRSKAK